MAMNNDALRALLEQNFAPWILQLGIEPLKRNDDGYVFVMPANESLLRGGNILCGQALASLADTVSVLTLFAHNDELRPVTTVDMNTQFLKTLGHEDVEARAIIQSNGKRMAQVRCEFRGRDKPTRLAASAGCTFLYL